MRNCFFDLVHESARPGMAALYDRREEAAKCQGIIPRLPPIRRQMCTDVLASIGSGGDLN
jgi:hypothetical protein